MLLWLSFLIISSVNGQYETCFTNDGRSGTCLSYGYCEQAKYEINQGIRPTFCYNYNRYIICCPSTYQNNPSRNKRISERKCEEYSKATKKVAIVTPLSLGSTSANQQSFVNYKCVQTVSLIIGGQKTKLGEFPHMAAIGWESFDGINFGCGGSLISNNFVLTACHCNVKRGRPRNYPKIVRLGDLDLRSGNDGANELDVNIQQFIMHEYYDSRTKKNDIGLIKLANSVSFTDNIRPACLWQNHNIASAVTTAIGYGKTSYYSPNSDELLKVQLNIYDNNDCASVESNIDSSQLCAGTKNSGNGDSADTCSGDSGGPIQIHYGSNKCIYYLIGITSYGSSYCGFAPSVYTRVSNYVDWIERIVWG